MSEVREVRFRGYSKSLNQMFDFNDYDFFISINVYHNFECYREYEKSGELQIEHLIPMQYTGLKDKNGKEIYEGDILRHKYLNDRLIDVDEVKFIEWGKHCYITRFENGGVCTSIDQITCRDCEIIGNIYENPELLIN